MMIAADHHPAQASRQIFGSTHIPFAPRPASVLPRETHHPYTVRFPSRRHTRKPGSPLEHQYPRTPAINRLAPVADASKTDNKCRQADSILSGLSRKLIRNSIDDDGLLHEEVGRTSQRVIRILHECRHCILWRTHQAIGNMVSVEVTMHRVKWQIATLMTTSLRRWACIAIWSMHHLSAGTDGRLAHRTSIMHHRA